MWYTGRERTSDGIDLRENHPCHRQTTRPLRTPQGKPAKSEPFSKGQLDFDIAFYDRILERDPNFVDVLRCQG